MPLVLTQTLPFVGHQPPTPLLSQYSSALLLPTLHPSLPFGSRLPPPADHPAVKGSSDWRQQGKRVIYCCPFAELVILLLTVESTLLSGILAYTPIVPSSSSGQIIKQT